MLYLRENFKPIFVEICNAYSEIMAKVYYKNFKTYQKTMNNFKVDIYTKHDLLYNENPSKIKLKSAKTVIGYH